MSLYVNGQLIEKYKEDNSGALDEDSMFLTLPDHILVDKKNATVWVGPLEAEDTEKLAEILKIDTESLTDKKCRIIFMSLGPKPRDGQG